MTLVHLALTEPNATAAPGSELGVAAIGLLGVLLGGLLQILFQLRRDRASARDQIRQTVLNGTTHAKKALSALYELASAGQSQFSSPSNSNLAVTPLASTQAGQDEKAKAAYAEADSALGRCAAVADRRVATQAQKLRNELVALFETYVNHFNLGALDEAKFHEFDKEKEVPAFSVSVLHTMIEPRWYERRQTFRSYKRSVRLTRRDKTRRDLSTAANDFDSTRTLPLRNRISPAWQVLKGNATVSKNALDAE